MLVGVGFVFGALLQTMYKKLDAKAKRSILLNKDRSRIKFEQDFSSRVIIKVYPTIIG